jgi:hypothetical protein
MPFRLLQRYLIFFFSFSFSGFKIREKTKILSLRHEFIGQFAAAMINKLWLSF